MTSNRCISMRDKSIVAQIIQYIIADGTENTSAGSWSIYFDEIPVEICDADFVLAHAEMIVDMLMAREEVLEAEIEDDAFSVIYSLMFCPNLQSAEDNAIYEAAQA